MPTPRANPVRDAILRRGRTPGQLRQELIQRFVNKLYHAPRNSGVIVFDGTGNYTLDGSISSQFPAGALYDALSAGDTPNMVLRCLARNVNGQRCRRSVHPEQPDSDDFIRGVFHHSDLFMHVTDPLEESDGIIITSWWVEDNA